MVLQTTAELVVAAFIVWRVFGLAATLIALGWQSHRERRAARWRETFSRLSRLEAEDFRQAGALMAGVGFSADDAAKAMARIGRQL